MLIFERSTGEIVAYAYIHLARVLFANSAIMLEFAKSAIRIEGSNLEPLALEIARHEVDLIRDNAVMSGRVESKIVSFKFISPEHTKAAKTENP